MLSRACIPHSLLSGCTSLPAGNKRLELAGGLLALLFEDLFKR